MIGAAFFAVEGRGLLATAYKLTRRLWLPIGLHLSWNFAQAGIFSGDVSGVKMPPGLLRSAVEGPVLMTCGPFGVESSLVAFLLCAAAGLVVLVMAARGTGIVRPVWSRHVSESVQPPGACRRALVSNPGGCWIG